MWRLIFRSAVILFKDLDLREKGSEIEFSVMKIARNVFKGLIIIHDIHMQLKSLFIFPSSKLTK